MWVAPGKTGLMIFVINIFLSWVRIIHCLKICNDFDVLFLIPVIENHLNSILTSLHDFYILWLIAKKKFVLDFW